MIVRLALSLLVCGLASCGAERSASDTRASSVSERALGPAAPANSAPAPRSPSTSAPPAPPVPALSGVAFRRELSADVLHIALDKPPHAAALTPASVFVHDRRGWREEPLPQPLRATLDPPWSVFYGRDFRVRVVGARGAPTLAESVYLRSLPAGLKSAPGEIGALANTRRGRLIAVLGTADPEVVCREDQRCLIKRISGWTALEAPSALHAVAIDAGTAWAVAGKQLLRGGQRWEAVGPEGTWQAPVSLLVLGEKAFVLEPLARRVHVLGSGGYAVVETPLAQPRAVWGARASAVWLVGEEGLARFDGSDWQRASGAPRGLRSVLGRSEHEVWVGGVDGLYRLDPDHGPAEIGQP